MTAFTTVETADLIGPALDWAVAQVESHPVSIKDGRVWDKGPEECPCYGNGQYEPSTDWGQGGPLIEKYKVATIEMGEPLEWHVIGISFDRGNNLCGEVEATGQTPLIAGMRAIVRAKLGDVVQVPAELVGGV